MAKVSPSAPQAKSLERLRTLIAPVSQLAGLGLILAGVLTWGIMLQLRVNTLEAKLQAVLISPASPNPENSLSTACANLAQRAADAMRAGDVISARAVEPIKNLMSELGCMAKK
jgi:biopolymer transport protein ExbB/TolQ